MPTLYLTTPGTAARLSSKHLEVEVPIIDRLPIESSSETRRIPLHEIEQVVANTNVSLSLAAIAAFAEHEIPVVITQANGRAIALCLPPAHDLPTRLTHYHSRSLPGFALGISSALIEAKIANSRRLLQRLAANRKQTPPPAVDQLEGLRSATLRANSVEACRGFEGASAACYFEALAIFFPESNPFGRRSRRPPLNVANALLSFGYALLTQETTTALHAAGLDPALGYLHEPETGRPSLALDLIEPFRSPLVDGLALDLLNHRTLRKEDHFEAREGGIYLNIDGRRIYYTNYERRIDRPFTSDLTGERTTLRNEIRQQIYSLKRHLNHQEPFSPFIMN